MTHAFADYTNPSPALLTLLSSIEKAKGPLNEHELSRLSNAYQKATGQVLKKDAVISAYRALAGTHGLAPVSSEMLRKLQMKPTRTRSGVTPVTVLTKPFPCPGKCIFCPNDIRMPKSYLADEPGAQRAERNWFDPYLQMYSRLTAFREIGHNTEKVELIVLGGTWSYYPEAYQIWFIKECFRALNDFGVGRDDRTDVLKKYEAWQKHTAEFVPGNDPVENETQLKDDEIHGADLHKSYNEVVSELYVGPEKIAGFDKYQTASWAELKEQQVLNETAVCRNVGLVLETRPDNISKHEVIKLRKFGCTKTQIGFQSLSDDVLEKNHRGHGVAATRQAVNLLRQAGFKIHAHWMPNLYGSTPELDKADYQKMFAEPDFLPDELKIYPCSLIESAELMQYYQRGEWKPYTQVELLDVLSFCLLATPRYCRLTRVIRDIPSTDIVTGNKFTNFREMVEKHLTELGQKSQDIRSREIRDSVFDAKDLTLHEEIYQTSVSTEYFLEWVTPADKVVGFLRLSLPTVPALLPELEKSAIIREIHIYGQSLGLGTTMKGKAQHLGLGSKLIDRAKKIAKEKSFEHLAVISAIGTRPYYRARGFLDGELYQRADLN